MYTKHIDNICPLSLSPFIHPSPTGIHPQTGPILHAYPSFFKCMLMVRWCFAIVLHTCILYFNQNNPLFTFSVALCPIIQQLSVHFVMLSSYTDVMQFNIIHSLLYAAHPLFPTSHHSLVQHTHKQSPIHGYFFFFKSSFHRWQETCNILLSESGLFHLIWWAPVPSIFLKIT
jgi:hypothetical protein